MRYPHLKRCAAVLLVLLSVCLLAGCREEGSTALLEETTEATPPSSVPVTTVQSQPTEITTVPTEEPTMPPEPEKTPWYETSRLIYHAAGKIGGFTYTNSKEAVENCLNQGNMLLEIDFLFTSDGHLVCLHEWPNLLGMTSPCTLERFLSLKIYNHFTTISAEQLIGYMREYPDMHLIIDTKEADVCAVVEELLRLCEYDPSIAQRFVIQLYDAGIRAQMQELYPFSDDNFLFTIYKFGKDRVTDIMNLCREEQIKVITVPYGSWDRETTQMVSDAGFLIFEHTLNFTTMTDNALSRGVYGFYTDSLQEADIFG